MTLALLQRVRDDAAWVMQHARDVTINHDRIDSYARDLVAQNPVLVTALDSENHFVAADDVAKTAAYVIALDSINFGSGAFHIAQRDGIDLEYHVVAQGLKHAFEQGQLSRVQDWAQVTAAQCHAVFGIPAGAHSALDRLMQQFAAHLKLSADCLVRDFGGIENLLGDYKNRGLALVDQIARWPHFDDIAQYDGRSIAIYKRALILLADLELAVAPGGTYFGGLQQLTCFADNMVPHVLRADGVITYSAALAARIDAGDMIDAGSTQETELRCAAIHVVELMRRALGDRYTSVNLDHMLWHRGYLPNFTDLKPHRTLSTWY